MFALCWVNENNITILPLYKVTEREVHLLGDIPSSHMNKSPVYRGREDIYFIKTLFSTEGFEVHNG